MNEKVNFISSKTEEESLIDSKTNPGGIYFPTDNSNGIIMDGKLYGLDSNVKNLEIWQGTKQAYNEIREKNPNCIYIINNDIIETSDTTIIYNHVLYNNNEEVLYNEDLENVDYDIYFNEKIFERVDYIQNKHGGIIVIPGINTNEFTRFVGKAKFMNYKKTTKSSYLFYYKSNNYLSVRKGASYFVLYTNDSPHPTSFPEEDFFINIYQNDYKVSGKDIDISGCDDFSIIGENEEDLVFFGHGYYDVYDNITDEENYYRLYYFKVYDDNTLVHEFIPVCLKQSWDGYQEGDYGLWDTVNDKFYGTYNISSLNYEIEGPDEDPRFEIGEYLEGSGPGYYTSQININHAPTSNTCVQADVSRIETPLSDSSTTQYIVGSVDSSSNNFIFYFVGGRLGYTLSNSSVNYLVSKKSQVNTKMHVYLNSSSVGFKYDNGFLVQGNISSGTFSGENSLHYFGVNAGSSNNYGFPPDNNTTIFFHPVRIYWSRVYESGKLVRDLIPVRLKTTEGVNFYIPSDLPEKYHPKSISIGEVGFYDKVNDIFYPELYDSENADARLVFRSKKPYKLQSSLFIPDETCSINTGYVVNTNSLVECDLRVTDYAPWDTWFVGSLMSPRTTSSSDSYNDSTAVNLYAHSSTSSSGSANPYYGWGSATSFQGVDASEKQVTNPVYVLFDYSKGTYIFNGGTETDIRRDNIFTNTAPLRIPARRAESETTEKSMRYGKSRDWYFYGLKIFENDILVRNYLPCKLIMNTKKTWDGELHFKGECGVWELVENKFYGNVQSHGHFETIQDENQNYEELEYIEGNGGAYINTGYHFIPSQMRVRLGVQQIGTNSSYQALFGTRDSVGYGGANSLNVWYISSSETLRFDAMSNGEELNAGCSLEEEVDIEVNIPNNFYFYDNRRCIRSITSTKSTERFESDMYLGWTNFDTDQRQFEGRIYYAKFWEGTKLVRNFVPCKLLSATGRTWDKKIHNAGEYGMWDKVENIFYGNNNTTGYYEGGDYYTQKTYVQGDGTAYINSLITHGTNPTVEVKAQGAYDSSYRWIFGWRTASGSSPQTVGMYKQSNYSNKIAVRRDSSNYDLIAPGNTEIFTVSVSKNMVIGKGISQSNHYFTDTECTLQAATGPYYIFALNQNGTKADYPWKGKIYYIKFYEDGDLVGNFIPCVLKRDIPGSMSWDNTVHSSGEVGLWNTVTNKFHGNIAGSGSFTTD